MPAHDSKQCISVRCLILTMLRGLQGGVQGGLQGGLQRRRLESSTERSCKTAVRTGRSFALVVDRSSRMQSLCKYNVLE